MADRYWVGNGAADWTTSGVGSGWSTTSGGAPGSAPPTVADDVFFDALSPACTVPSSGGKVCRSLNCVDGTGGAYANTLTHAAATNIAIGDGTAGAGNVALKLSPAMTYALGHPTSAAIQFATTSSTEQTIEWGGKTPGNVSFISTFAGNLKLLDAWVAPTTVTYNSVSSAATVNLNGQTCSWNSFVGESGTTKTLILGAATITCNSWRFRGIIPANTATLTQSGAAPSFDNATNAGADYNGLTLVQSGSGTANLGSAVGFAITLGNYTRTSTTLKTDAVSIGNNVTVTGTIRLDGNSIVNRLLVQSSVVGTPRTITAATQSASTDNVDFIDITGAGAASWDLSAKSAGDGQGNSGITFPAPTTQTHTAGGSSSWSDVTRWTSRVPLPQDDVVVGGGHTGTLTLDMPRLGRNVDFTGFTAIATRNIACDVYGSLTLAVGMTWSSTNTGTLALRGRGAHTLTSNGQVINNRSSNPGGMTVNAATGTYTLTDAMIVNNMGASNGSNLVILSGTLDTADFPVTIGSTGSSLVMTGGHIDFGASTITFGVTLAESIVSITGGTMSAENATFVLAVASANTRTFAGGGKSYGTLTYTVAGSTGTLVITGSNTFKTINFSDANNARSLLFTAGTTTTVLNSFNVNGTAGKLMPIGSVTAANHTLIVPPATNLDYLSISRSTLLGMSAYAGANSIDGGSNSVNPGWIFAQAAKGNFLAII